MMRISFLFLTIFAAAALAANTQWIDDIGGHVTRDTQGRVTGVSLRGTWVGDADLRHLTELPNLNSLDLSLTHITDQGMTEIRGGAGGYCRSESLFCRVRDGRRDCGH